MLPMPTRERGSPVVGGPDFLSSGSGMRQRRRRGPQQRSQEDVDSVEGSAHEAGEGGPSLNSGAGVGANVEVLVGRERGDVVADVLSSSRSYGGLEQHRREHRERDLDVHDDDVQLLRRDRVLNVHRPRAEDSGGGLQHENKARIKNTAGPVAKRTSATATTVAASAQRNEGASCAPAFVRPPQMAILERIESERCWFWGGFSSSRLLFTDPPPWRNAHTGGACEPPRHVENGTTYRWTVSVSPVTDDNGWSYSRSFRQARLTNKATYRSLFRERRHIGQPIVGSAVRCGDARHAVEDDAQHAVEDDAWDGAVEEKRRASNRNSSSFPSFYSPPSNENKRRPEHLSEMKMTTGRGTDAEIDLNANNAEQDKNGDFSTSGGAQLGNHVSGGGPSREDDDEGMEFFAGGGEPSVRTSHLPPFGLDALGNLDVEDYPAGAGASSSFTSIYLPSSSGRAEKKFIMEDTEGDSSSSCTGRTGISSKYEEMKAEKSGNRNYVREFWDRNLLRFAKHERKFLYWADYLERRANLFVGNLQIDSEPGISRAPTRWVEGPPASSTASSFPSNCRMAGAASAVDIRSATPTTSSYVSAVMALFVGVLILLSAIVPGRYLLLFFLLRRFRKGFKAGRYSRASREFILWQLQQDLTRCMGHQHQVPAPAFLHWTRKTPMKEVFNWSTTLALRDWVHRRYYRSSYPLPVAQLQRFAVLDDLFKRVVSESLCFLRHAERPRGKWWRGGWFSSFLDHVPSQIAHYQPDSALYFDHRWQVETEG